MINFLRSKFLTAWLSLLFTIFGVFLFLTAHNTTIDREVLPTEMSSIHLTGGIIVPEGDLWQLIFDSETQLMTLLVPYPEELPPDVHLKLVIEGFENVTAIILGYQDEVVSKGTVDRVYTPLFDPEQSILRFGLRQQSDDHFLLRFKRADLKNPATIAIRAIVFESGSFYSSRTFFLLAFLCNAALLVCIAIIVLSVMHSYLPFSRDESLALFPLAASIGLFVGYLWLLVVLHLDGGPLLFSAGWGLLFTGVSCRRWQRMRRSLVLVAGRVNTGALAYYSLIIVIAATLSYGHDAPLYDISWISIAFQKTYHSFTAHDNVFQYLNTLAIIDGKPFAYFYHAQHLPYLLYGVEHRGVLAGLLCAPVMFLLGNGGHLAGGEFALFVICGSSITASAIFPVIAFWRRYSLRANPCLVVLLFSANSYIMVNYYYTWFKLLSGGLVLTGVYLLLLNSRKWSKWMVAGISWGGATGLHAGAILALPAIGLFLWVRGIFFAKKKVGQIVIAPLILIIAFAGMNLPWAIIKAKHFPDNNSLFKVHFLNGHNNPDGLFASARDFWIATPPEVQWEFRTQRLYESLKIKTLKKFFSEFKHLSLKKNLAKWTKLEFTFVAIILYPLCLLALLASLLPGKTKLLRPAELFFIFLTSIFSLTANLFIHFNRVHIPDLTWHLPSFTIMLLQICLLIVATGRGKITATLCVIFALAGYWRFAILA